MEIHVYLHRNGGFPNIYKDAYPAFIENQVIINDMDGEVLIEYPQDEVFRIDILMTEEKESYGY